MKEAEPPEMIVGRTHNSKELPPTIRSTMGKQPIRPVDPGDVLPTIRSTMGEHKRKE